MINLKEYDRSTLIKVQQLELGILKEFSEICQKHNWDYFVIAGTALGCVRHKGFIPWDDDIDVGMPRKDLNQFLEYVRKNLSHKYLIINAETYENYPLMTTQLALKGTSFVVDYFKNLDIPFGIYLDIFPFDNACDDDKKLRNQGLKTWFYNKLQILRNIPAPYVSATGTKKKIIHAITYTVHYLLVMLGISGRSLYQKALAASTMYNNEDTHRFSHFASTKYNTYILDKNKIYPLQALAFEGITVWGPSDTANHLKKTYGNYMELPPIEKRKNHLPYKLDFGKYKEETV